MSMPELKSTVGTIRAYAQKRVDQSSLRDVADEVGMSFSGLRSFLSGTSPHPRTVKRLVGWYAVSRAGKLPPRATPIARSEVDVAVSLIAMTLKQVPVGRKRLKSFRAVCARIAAQAEIEAAESETATVDRDD